MPVEQAAGTDRRGVTHLEALGRLLAGIAPWIELPADATPEGRMRADYADLARRAIARAVDPASPDFLNFTRERQPLVDAAFLAQGLLRAPRALRDALDAGDEATAHRGARVDARHRAAVQQLAAVLRDGRSGAGGARRAVGSHARRLRAPPARAVVQGRRRCTATGPTFHWDYYNSFVIHPMLRRRPRRLPGRDRRRGRRSTRACAARAPRYAAIQERLIAPDGSFPPIGRSIAYRCGAFHLLAQTALRRALPEGVSPGAGPRRADRA